MQAKAKGDIRANYEQLKIECRQIKYLNPLEQGQITDGIPIAFLPIIHHTLLLYSPLVATFISERGFELQAKSDFKFIQNTYKILLDYFGGYKPQITVQQFFTKGFGECKIIMCNEIIGLVKEKHRELYAEHSKLIKATSVSQPLKDELPQPEEAPQPRSIYSLQQDSNRTPSLPRAPGVKVVRHNLVDIS